MSEPTRKQQRILDFILKWKQSGGNSPTFQEIADHFRFRSLNSVTKHLRLLRQKGFLESDSGKARSLRITSPLAKLRSRIVDIPIFGSIPAGMPESREQDVEGLTSVDTSSLGFIPTRNTFALRIRGNSMIGKHICDGDIVILEFGAEPRDGQVVAAYVDGQSTLKTFIVKNGKPYLRAENPNYRDIIPAQELTIQGVLKGLIRKTDY
jgi:repressor LexA